MSVSLNPLFIFFLRLQTIKIMKKVKVRTSRTAKTTTIMTTLPCETLARCAGTCSSKFISSSGRLSPFSTDVDGSFSWNRVKTVAVKKQNSYSRVPSYLTFRRPLRRKLRISSFFNVSRKT